MDNCFKWIFVCALIASVYCFAFGEEANGSNEEIDSLLDRIEQRIGAAQTMEEFKEAKEREDKLEARPDYPSRRLNGEYRQKLAKLVDRKMSIKSEMQVKLEQLREDIQSYEKQYNQQKAELAGQPDKLEQLKAEHDRKTEQFLQQEAQILSKYENLLAEIDAEIAAVDTELDIADRLPEDTSDKLMVSEMVITGNTLVSDRELIVNLPLYYNSSDMPVSQAIEKGRVYDLTPIHKLIEKRGDGAIEISARTIRGLTEYFLDVYRSKRYVGIYVYVPEDTTMMQDGKLTLKDQKLVIAVLESKVDNLQATKYRITGDPEMPAELKERSYLREDILFEWSPPQPGQTINEKELDDFLDLLNLNPDRYVEAIITRGQEPNDIAVEYSIYETSPWNFFFQIDNSGTDERKWNPRVGVVNTNLTGRDDRASFVWTSPIDSDINDNYSMYFSYDFPLWSPKLRMNLYAGHSEFDISPDSAAGFNFRGQGDFAGAVLRYNVMQKDDWFFDLTSSLAREKSEVTPSLGISTDVEMLLWGMGLDVYKSTEMEDVYISYNFQRSFGGSSDQFFNDARTNADSTFDIHTIDGTWSRYCDRDKIHRFLASGRWILPNDRLVPAKMTSFGGLYTVRGYDEEQIVADGGFIASIQYEHDFMAKWNPVPEDGSPRRRTFPDRLALAPFFDYANTRILDPVAGEDRSQDLMSFGLGVVTEYKESVAGIYYGIPVTSVTETDSGDGRWSFNFLVRW